MCNGFAAAKYDQFNQVNSKMKYNRSTEVQQNKLEGLQHWIKRCKKYIDSGHIVSTSSLKNWSVIFHRPAFIPNGNEIDAPILSITLKQTVQHENSGLYIKSTYQQTTHQSNF